MNPSNFFTGRNKHETDYLDGNVLADAAKVHDYLMEMLDFPEYYGKNLDALHDCLTDLEDIEITITAPEEDGAIFQRILRVFKASENENDSINLLLS